MKPPFCVLIIDDEKIVYERLSLELERSGLEVEAFTDSAQALQRNRFPEVDVFLV